MSGVDAVRKTKEGRRESKCKGPVARMSWAQGPRWLGQNGGAE